MTSPKGAVRLTPEAMAKHIPDEAGNRFHVALERGQLQVELYIPEGKDLQGPHDRDECYVVINGSGRFRMGEEVVPFKAGDFFFVPRGNSHTDFWILGERLETWVIFPWPRGRRVWRQRLKGPRFLNTAVPDLGERSMQKKPGGRRQNEMEKGNHTRP